MSAKSLTFGSLFAGIGGLDLGLERAGMQCVWQVERDVYCRKVLAKHWPNVTRYEDVKDVGRGNLAPVDLIAGGFPCQDISVAGRGAGILAGARSGLWFEFARIVQELQPDWVVVENVAGIEGKTQRASRDAVLGHLRSLGYGGERTILSAADVGAPQRRDRWFVLANAKRAGLSRPVTNDPLPLGAQETHTILRDGTSHPWLALAGDRRRLRSPDGIPVRVERDRIRALGNAVVPQVAERIGRRIVQAHNEMEGAA